MSNALGGAFSSFIKKKQLTNTGVPDDPYWTQFFKLQSFPTSARLIKRSSKLWYYQEPSSSSSDGTHGVNNSSNNQGDGAAGVVSSDDEQPTKNNARGGGSSKKVKNQDTDDGSGGGRQSLTARGPQAANNSSGDNGSKMVPSKPNKAAPLTSRNNGSATMQSLVPKKPRPREVGALAQADATSVELQSGRQSPLHKQQTALLTGDATKSTAAAAAANIWVPETQANDDGTIPTLARSRRRAGGGLQSIEDDPIVHAKSTIPFLVGGMFQLGYYKKTGGADHAHHGGHHHQPHQQSPRSQPQTMAPPALPASSTPRKEEPRDTSASSPKLKTQHRTRTSRKESKPPAICFGSGKQPSSPVHGSKKAKAATNDVDGANDSDVSVEATPTTGYIDLGGNGPALTSEEAQTGRVSLAGVPLPPLIDFGGALSSTSRGGTLSGSRAATTDRFSSLPSSESQQQQGGAGGGAEPSSPHPVRHMVPPAPLPIRDDVDGTHDVPLLEMLARVRNAAPGQAADAGHAGGSSGALANNNDTAETGAKRPTAAESRAASKTAVKSRAGAASTKVNDDLTSPRSVTSTSTASPRHDSRHHLHHHHQEPSSPSSITNTNTTTIAPPTASATSAEQRQTLYKDIEQFERAVVIPILMAQAAEAAAAAAANGGGAGNNFVGSASMAMIADNTDTMSVSSSMSIPALNASMKRQRRLQQQAKAAAGGRTVTLVGGAAGGDGGPVPLGRGQRLTGGNRRMSPDATGAAVATTATAGQQQQQQGGPNSPLVVNAPSAIDLAVPLLPAIARNPITGLLCGVDFTRIAKAADTMFAHKPMTRSHGLTIDDFRDWLASLVPGANELTLNYLHKMFDPFVPPGTNAVPIRAPFAPIFSYLCKYNGRTDVERNLRVFFSCLDASRRGVIPTSALQEDAIIAWAQNRVIGRALKNWIRVGKAFGRSAEEAQRRQEALAKLNQSSRVTNPIHHPHHFGHLSPKGTPQTQSITAPPPATQHVNQQQPAAHFIPPSTVATPAMFTTGITLDDFRMIVYSTPGIADAMGSDAPLECVLTDAPRYPLKEPPPMTPLVVLNKALGVRDNNSGTL